MLSGKRALDIFLLLFIAPLAVPSLVGVSIIVKFTSEGGVLFWSERVGRNNTIFNMPKFRTMQKNTPLVATHLLNSPHLYLSPIGNFLRKLSLDELPQLWNILLGEMSFVGPRPALFNQYDLIKLRNDHGIDALVPGLTGWAQINGRDQLTIEEKVHYDFEYLQYQSLFFDLRILYLTLVRVFLSSGVSH